MTRLVVSSGESNQAASTTTEAISHDLRTPLTVIIGFAELMLDEVPGQINEEQRQCLIDILNSATRLLNLTNQILGHPNAAGNNVTNAGKSKSSMTGNNHGQKNTCR